MRVIIYGAGGIGGVVGGYLARSGHDVVLIGRPGHVKAINECGLRLVTPTATHVLQLPAVTSPDQIDFRPDDVVCLCMKGQDTEEAVRDLRTVIEEVPIFCFQDGVHNEEIVAQYFEKVYGVVVRVGAVYLTAGEVVARMEPPGWFVIGCYPQGTDELAEKVAKKLRSGGFSVIVTQDVMSYKWGKLVEKVGAAVGAITNAGGEDVDFVARAARQEFRDILTQAGICWISQDEMTEKWREFEMALRSRGIHAEAGSSTRQSLTRRTGTIETGVFNGEVVRLAKKLGRRAPINEGLLRISQEMAVNRETPGKYTPNQLRQLLGLLGKVKK